MAGPTSYGRRTPAGPVASRGLRVGWVPCRGPPVGGISAVPRSARSSGAPAIPHADRSIATPRSVRGRAPPVGRTCAARVRDADWASAVLRPARGLGAVSWSARWRGRCCFARSARGRALSRASPVGRTRAARVPDVDWASTVLRLTRGPGRCVVVRPAPSVLSHDPQGGRAPFGTPHLGPAPPVSGTSTGRRPGSTRRPGVVS